MATQRSPSSNDSSARVVAQLNFTEQVQPEMSERPKPLRVVLIAEESAGVQALRMLAEMGHTVVAVLASPQQRSVGLPNLCTVAHSLGFNTWPAQIVKDPDLAGQIASLGIDLILNVHSLQIIHNEILRAARLGAFNLHPGPLPRYAGLNAVSWAIYRGETTHGVTLHKMVAEVDAGPIAYQAFFPINAADSALVVATRCVREGMVLLRHLLKTASCAPHEIPLIPQDLSKREYFHKGIPNQGRISWPQPARAIVDFVRACDFYPFPSPWGNPHTHFNGCEIAVAKACLSREPTGGVTPGSIRRANGIQVAAQDEWITLQQLVFEGRRVDPADVLTPGDVWEAIAPAA